jgi:thioredoxin-related protein
MKRWVAKMSQNLSFFQLLIVKQQMRNLLTLVALSFVFLISTSFSLSKESAIQQTTTIKWLTMEEAIQLSKVEEKKILVDLYTDWCGWCKRMDATTFSDPYIVKYINDNYYPVKFNAEQKDPLVVGEQTYKFVKGGGRSGGYHEFAASLTNGRMGFPTVVFISEKMEVIQAVPGYQDANRFEYIMTYFGGNHHKSTPWATFEKDYKVKGKR